jgi:hypothetical protein
LLESDVRDDRAHVKILRCLQDLPSFHNEAMFVLSQLDFGDYLNQPAFAAAAKTLPRPVDLKSLNKHRGDFDLLIIHRLYGILASEIKAVGDQLASLPPQQRSRSSRTKSEAPSSSCRRMTKCCVTLRQTR